MTAITRNFALFLTLAALPAAADIQDFPRPAELEPDIGFWVTVFTETTSDQGLLHDNRNLAVVYERLNIPASVGRRERNRRAETHRKHYKFVLNTLAKGKRDKLTTEEKRVLELWPANVSNKTLRDARNQIRLQQGLSDRFRAGLERAGRYRAHVQNEFARLGVPVEFRMSSQDSACPSSSLRYRMSNRRITQTPGRTSAHPESGSSREALRDAFFRSITCSTKETIHT